MGIYSKYEEHLRAGVKSTPLVVGKYQIVDGVIMRIDNVDSSLSLFDQVTQGVPCYDPITIYHQWRESKNYGNKDDNATAPHEELARIDEFDNKAVETFYNTWGSLSGANEENLCDFRTIAQYVKTIYSFRTEISNGDYTNIHLFDIHIENFLKDVSRKKYHMVIEGKMTRVSYYDTKTLSQAIIAMIDMDAEAGVIVKKCRHPLCGKYFSTTRKNKHACDATCKNNAKAYFRYHPELKGE